MVNKTKMTILIGLIATTTLMATDIKPNIILHDYENKQALEKIYKNLDVVEKDGLTTKNAIEAQKWGEVNGSLWKLIEEKNFMDAYALFKHVNYDTSLKDYQNFYSFFQIMNSLQGKSINFEHLKNIKNDFLINTIFASYFELLKREKINDFSSLQKIEVELNVISNEVMPYVEKQKVLYKLHLLKGNYIEAYNIINQIPEEKYTKEDYQYRKNISNILKYMQEYFFVNGLKVAHKDFQSYNILYRSQKTQKLDNK